MHIIDVFGGEKMPVSFEIFPPKGDLPVEEAREVIGGLAPLSPSFVSVTYSAGGSGNSSRTIDVAKMAQDENGARRIWPEHDGPPYVHERRSRGHRFRACIDEGGGY